MNLREGLANFLTKGELSFIRKGYEDLKATPRPGLGNYDAEEKEPDGLYNRAFYLERKCSIFSDIVLTLRQEIFRNGVEWQPAFEQKCLLCGAEYDEAVEICDCGSATFRSPDKTQFKFFDRQDGGGRTFLEKANDNGQNFLDVLGDNEFNLDVADNSYLLVRKSYIYDDAGNILAGVPKEVLSVDPRDLRKVYGKDGTPGGMTWFCPEHRGETTGPDGKDKPCPVCGKRLREALFVTTGPDKKYYFEGEAYHQTKYYPSILYGYPPILKAVDEARTYHFLEKRIKAYYERARSPGFVAVPAANSEALTKVINDIKISVRDDPYSTPFINFDPSGKAVTFVKLMEDPGPAMLEVKKEIRERLGSRFGVSLIFMGDTSTSGGLNNEGLQLTVTNRAAQWGQSIHNQGALPWLCRQFGITDFILQLNPSEEQDEMAEKQRFALDVQTAEAMLRMGFNVELKDGIFTFSGEAKPTGAPSPFIPGAPPPEKPVSEPQGTPPDLQRGADIGKFTPPEAGNLPEAGKKILAEVYSSCRQEWVDAHPKDRENPSNKESCSKIAWAAVERAGYSSKSESVEKVFEPPTPDEFDSLTKDELVKSWADDALLAIGEGALYPFYEGVAQSDIPIIHKIIASAFRKREFSLTRMAREIVEATNLTPERAEVIARTESSAVANKAREIGWGRMEEERGEKFIYRWSVRHDARTSDICLEIEKRVGDGKTMDELKAIVKAVSTDAIPGWTGWDSLVAHPNERSTPVRVVTTKMEREKLENLVKERELMDTKMALLKKMGERL